MNTICRQLYTNFPSTISIVCRSVNEEMLDIPNFKEKTIREQEYSLGRYCAKQAMKTIGIDCNVIQSSSHGFPIWPNGIVGSISHSKGVCLSAVAKSMDFESIGIDIEQFNRMKQSSVERITHQKEIVEIGTDLKKATLLFSVKEAFYKAQFPIYKTPLNFKDLAFSLDFASQQAKLVWLSDKSPIAQSEYSEWKIAYKIIENTCFVLCSKDNIGNKSK